MNALCLWSDGVLHVKQDVIQDCWLRNHSKIPLTPFRKGGMVESPPFLKGDLGGFLPTVVNHTG